MSISAVSPVGVDALVDPEWIAAHLDDPMVRVIEVDVSPAAYDAGHVPGAVFWNAYGDLRPVAYRPLAPEALSDLLSRSEIAPDTTVVFYGYAAYLGFWLLRSHGHAGVRLMDGSRERWREDGREWSLDARAARPVGPACPLHPTVDAVTGAEVAGLIGDPDAVLLDVRSDAEFAGECFWPSGAAEDGGRAGHIPGAVWVPVEHVRAPDGSLADAAGLQGVYEGAGVTPDRHVVVYCTIGNRASQVWFVLKYLLGYPRVSVYYGSWAEWGTTPDAPVET